MDIARQIVPPWVLRSVTRCADGCDAKEQVRLAITALALGFNLLFCLFTVFYVELFLAHFLGPELVYARVVLYTGIGLYGLAGACLFWWQLPDLARVLILANLYLSCVVGILITGGYTLSPIVNLIVLPAVFGFVLLGARAGVWCAGLAAATVLGICLLEEYGLYTATQLIHNPLAWRSLALLMPLVTLAMVVFSLLLYELLTHRLEQALQHERNQFHWDATHDALTSLPNRPEFYSRLTTAMRQAERSGQPLALVFFDLDCFKPVNDTMGHYAGDAVLKILGQRLASLMRSVDTVARLGGDEFAVILPDVSAEPSALEAVVQKIIWTIREPMEVDGVSVAVGVSLGVAFYQPGISLEDLCKHADASMYEAKRQPDITWHVYSAA